MSLRILVGALLALVVACSESNFAGSGKAREDDKKNGGGGETPDAATTIPVGDTSSIFDIPGVGGDDGDKPGIDSIEVDDPSIAAVDDEGNITGLSPGTTTVTVTFDDGTTQTIKVTVTDDGGTSTGGPGFQDVKNDTEGGASVITENAETGLRREVFAFGEDGATLVDFLFVMDNSCSMGQIIDRTAAGFASLGDSDVFPDKARMAVMTTMPGDPADLAKVNKVAMEGGGYKGIELEPGFLDLVNKERIEKFKAGTNAKYQAKWPKAGCKASWFSPGAKNEAGDACITAHTQQSYYCVGVEAGLTAVHQLMEKNDGKRFFRKGAVLNVIFVSDTHDPGHASKAFTDLRPSYDALKARIEKDNTLAGLKFHGIVPEAKCGTGEELYGKSYHPFIEQSGGEKVDSCTTEDYGDFIRKMAEKAKVPQKALLKLSKKAERIVKVLVDGKPYDAYELDAEKDTLTLPDLDPTKKVSIIVIYAYE